MGKHYHKMQCSITIATLMFVNFWCKNRNSSNWCAQQSKGIPSITLNLILLTLYFFYKTYSFPCKKCNTFNSVFFAKTYSFPCKKCFPTIYKVNCQNYDTYETKGTYLKDCLPHLFHGFRNKYFNRIR